MTALKCRAAGQQTSKSGEAHQGNPSRWQARFRRIAVAATKQSLRAHGLQLGEVTPLEMWLPEIKAKSVALVAAAGAPEMLGSPAVQRKLSSLRCATPCIPTAPEQLPDVPCQKTSRESAEDVFTPGDQILERHPSLVFGRLEAP